MGRKPTITRDHLLELAEIIVRDGGAAALTIDALAKAAGISKGGVQYSFASKDDLVRALVNRWTDQFDAIMGPAEALSPVEFVQRYMKAVRASQSALDAKMAGLMITYLQNPQDREDTRAWYRSVFDRLGGSDRTDQAARVLFLALEGLFMLRMIDPEDDAGWKARLADIESIAADLLV
ncbi:MAG: TetR/AcrR family transcriptional regulator [Paracoccus denitrificans]|nr:MAG: TetR/AcrR family transcriptional regulator [Paracoccus denitrificans]PZO83629.1 MAG: TetR/AcrR family transcriptional regulator [Paracoccus denitrificans]